MNTNMKPESVVEALERYLHIMSEHPELLQPLAAPLKIIQDVVRIRDWQREHSFPLIGVLYEDKYITLVRDLVENPLGQVFPYLRIINTAVLEQGTSGVAMLPVFNGKVLLINIFRHPIRQWNMEIPRGFGEAGMTSIEVVEKELSEEIEGVVKTVEPLGAIYANSGLEANQTQLYYIELEQVGASNEGEGITEIVQVSVKELEMMIRNAVITDAFTITAYTRAKLKGLL